MATLERLNSDRQHYPYWLEPERSPVRVGRKPDNDLVLDNDASASGHHAELTYKGKSWWVTDVGSMNGTFVNGERIAMAHQLWDNDTIRLGNTNLLLHDESRRRSTRTTRPVKPPPALTLGEKRVLIELCRPMKVRNGPFTTPTSVADIAKVLYVVKGAVQAHVEHMYDKFAIYPDEPGDRRVRLANAAFECGAITWRDFESDDGPDESDGQD